jgi:hypothetical protein
MAAARAAAAINLWPFHVSLLKRLRTGRLNSETAVWRFQKQNGHLDPEAFKKIRWGF